MITANTDELKQFESDLKTFAARAYPFATKSTLNSAAFDARRRYVENAKDSMTLRNKFTASSVRVDQARTLNVGRQSATVGSIAPYMDEQEFGGVKRAKGKKGVPLATSVASGEGEGVQPRRRLPTAPNRLARIKFGKVGKKKFKSRRQEIFVKTLMAVRSGKRYLYLDTNNKQAIYRIKGRGRLDKRGRITGIQMRMVYDLSHKTIRIPRNPMLDPAVKATERIMPELYREALIFQLRRQNLFRG